MERSTAVLFIVVAGALAYGLAGNTASDSNIEERRDYWTQQLQELQAPVALDGLTAFARSHGQALHCYQNGPGGEDRCRITDQQSYGGLRGHPLQLAIIFTMQDDESRDWELVTAPVTPPER